MMNKNRRSTILLTGIVLTITIFSQCLSRDKKTIVKNDNGEPFAGSTTCQSCHKNIYDSFIHTAHYLDSRPASKEAIKGSFTKGNNYYVYNYNANRIVAMEEKETSFYQVAYINRKPNSAHRFDMVIGSGRKGQSYLYWKDNYLFQLPISYYTPENSWVNSPGFQSSVIDFNRVIYARCLECHSTYAKRVSKAGIAMQPDKFDQDQIIYGIDCERCHGAAAKHVAFHTQHPKEKIGKFILNPSRFSRQQRLDVCALCHSGTRENLKPVFSFVAGDTLSSFYKPNETAASNADLDVHGNQYGLLSASKCFMLTQTLDCSTCHNTHVNQKNNLALFSQRCMNCHSPATHNFCKMAATIGKVIERNCIDCHMPTQASKTLTMGNPKLEHTTPALVRSHFISIYPEATQKFISTMKTTPH